MEADYLILGGGLAGSVIASRLAASIPSARITVLEAGQDESSNPLTQDALKVFGLHYSKADWAYKTTPQKQLGGREVYLGAGKALGGSTATNYGVWTRGDKKDYDDWATAVDSGESWSYSDLLKYMKRTEKSQDTSNPDAHGYAGPISTDSVTSSSPNRKYPLRDTVRDALAALGLKELSDGNSGSPVGFSDRVENWREGKRQIAANAYGLQTFPNVCVKTGQMVKRIILKQEPDRGAVTAIGAETMDGTIHPARREVILSCGAIRSSQMLLLSGIGPLAELKKHSIQQLVELPVGQDFHDHLSLCQYWKLSQPELGLSMGTPSWENEPAYQLGIPADWIAWTRGASRKDSGLAFSLDKDNDAELSESDCHQTWARKATNDQDRARIEIFVPYVPAGAGFQNHNLIPDGTHITSITVHVLPTSSGTISLASTDPTDMPCIDPNYANSAADRADMRAGIRDAMACMVALKNPDGSAAVVGENPPPGVQPLTPLSSDDEIDHRVQQCSQTLFHYGGGCCLGRVVDSECRVKGVNGLRVADASIMPNPVSAHYQVAVYAIAEKAADLIAAASQ